MFKRDRHRDQYGSDGHRLSFSEMEEGRFFLWLPVFIGIGIGIYFAMKNEPSLKLVSLIIVTAVFFAAWARYYFKWLVVSSLVLAMTCGFVLAKVRTEMVRAPVIAKSKGTYEITGRVERVSKRRSNELRLVLSQLAIKGVRAQETPVRIRLITRLKRQSASIGETIRIRAVLRPPPGPVRPDGFDFARKLWFQQIGAIGFAISRMEHITVDQPLDMALSVEKVRLHVAYKIKTSLTGMSGGIAQALIVGDKSAIDKPVLEAIRAAGLAHMLAISGMHMALVAGGVYWLIRALLALGERVTLTIDIRKPAALMAVLAAGLYFLLSGSGISTFRAFIMISIMFMAVFLGRRAISLRNVSIAALIILVMMPESLLDVSFQMSFAAVVALVAFYENGLMAGGYSSSRSFPIRTVTNMLVGLRQILFTTLIAGVAVAPIAVYHFHHVTSYSAIGNVLAMPVLTLLVMPMALLSMATLPAGLQNLPLFMMGEGIDLIVSIAEMVSSLEKARINVGTIGLPALLLIVAGGLWLFLWRSRFRYFGVVGLVLGLTATQLQSAPFLLVEREGKNVAYIDLQNKMWPVKPRAGQYSLDKWRSAYGTKLIKGRQVRTVGIRKATSPWRCEEQGCTLKHKSLIISYSMHPATLSEDCQRAQILIATYPVSWKNSPCDKTTILIDHSRLRKNGSHTLYLQAGKLQVINARERRGQRPWSRNN